VSVKPEGSPNISRLAGIITSENYKELLKEVKNVSTRSVERIVARHSPGENYFDTIKPIFLRTASSEGKSPEMGNRESGKIFTAGAGSRKRDFSSAGNTSSDLPREDKESKNSAEYSKRFFLKQKYKLRFAVDPEFLKKLKKIKSLLSTKYPNGINLEQVFDILMDEYLERRSPERRIERREKRESSQKRKTKYVSKDNRKRRKENSGHRTRDIPAAVRDEVYRRDKGRCSFVGRNGRRCGSTWNLQIDHIVPFARGGDNSPCNLRLLCERHNRLEAERAYGKDFMRKYIRKE